MKAEEKKMPTRLEDIQREFVTVRELASIAGVSRYTIYDRINDGSLGIPVYPQFGPRSTRFARRHVQEFIERNALAHAA